MANQRSILELKAPLRPPEVDMAQATIGALEVIGDKRQLLRIGDHLIRESIKASRKFPRDAQTLEDLKGLADRAIEAIES